MEMKDGKYEAIGGGGYDEGLRNLRGWCLVITFCLMQGLWEQDCERALSRSLY